MTTGLKKPHNYHMQWLIILIPPALGALSYFVSEHYGLYNSEVGMVFVTIVISFEFYLLYRMRKNSSGSINELSDSEKNQPKTDEQEINFSDIPASMEGEAPKPIDKTGNVFLHNEETLTEDMANLGIDRYKKDES